MTMRCSKHGEVETFGPMGPSPICPKCCDEERELARLRADHPRNVLERLDGIDAALDRALAAIERSARIVEDIRRMIP